MSANNNFGIPGNSSEPSEIWLVTVSGTFASVATSVPNFLTVSKNVGRAMAYKQNPAMGMWIEIMEDGFYMALANGERDAGSTHIYITVNSKDLVTPANVPDSQLIAHNSNPALTFIPVTGGAWLKKGDIVRMQYSNASADNAALHQFRISKIANP